MTSIRKIKIGTFFVVTICLSLLCGGKASADGKSQPPLKFGFDVKGQYVSQDNRDLGTGNTQFADTFAMDARMRITYRIARNALFYWEGRAVGTRGSLSGEEDNGADAPAGDYLEWRQSWLKFSHLADVFPLDLQIGRQRIKESYGLWWNRDIDAIRLNYTSSSLKGFVGIAENMAPYRSDKSDFFEDDQERLRLMAEAMWAFDQHYSIEARMLHEHDHSGSWEVGDIFGINSLDREDADLTWAGLRMVGNRDLEDGRGLKGWSYRVDGVAVAGEEEMVSSALTAPGSLLRSVTGVNRRDVLGWGVDLGTSVTLELPGTPVLLFGYAYGSGDDGSGTDTAFRQSGIQGNAGRQGISTTTIHNYGEVFRPELSNLHILKAGLTLPILQSSDVSMIYYCYALADKAQGPRYSTISAPVTTMDSWLGHEADLVMNYNLDEELQGRFSLPDSALKISLGAFKAGDAYGEAEDEVAFRGLADLRIRF